MVRTRQQQPRDLNTDFDRMTLDDQCRLAINAIIGMFETSHRNAQDPTFAPLALRNWLNEMMFAPAMARRLTGVYSNVGMDAADSIAHLIDTFTKINTETFSPMKKLFKDAYPKGLGIVLPYLIKLEVLDDCDDKFATRMQRLSAWYEDSFDRAYIAD